MELVSFVIPKKVCLNLRKEIFLECLMAVAEWRVESVGELRLEHLKLIRPCFPSFSEQPENSHSKTIFKPVITLFFISRDKFCLKLSSPVRSPVNLGWFPANLILKDRIIHFISFH